MKSDFKFSNLLGTVYRQGNLVYTSDGKKLLSPVGNRVSCFDLINNKSFTFNYEHRKNVRRIALNKQGTLLLSVDEDGRAILVNFVSRIVLHHFNFKDAVNDLQFSPNGEYFAIAMGRFIQVWKTPDFTEDRQFAPFVRHRIYAGHNNDVLSVTWSNDLRFFISTSKDMTSKIFSLLSAEKDVAMTLAGHRDYVIRAFFNETQEIIYTISKDGALFQWEYTERPTDGESEDEEEEEDSDDEESDSPKKPMSWRITAKNFFHSEARVKCATFHSKSNLLIVGFSNGEFRLYELPEFNLIQLLSMGQNSVSTVNINATGEWLAFGSSKLGQLLVYEWQSESYILKQQGHFDLMNALCYSPDGSRVVTASDDGKIKVWDVVSGFCLVTFSEHTSSVTAVQFAKRGQVLFSASLDGTVRAWDLIRFRNFRTFTATERIQFNSLAVDPLGEIVVAGSQDTFEIQIWSVQTSQLLDTLAGHEGPISCLSFGNENGSILASASWDKTIRIWNIFGRSQHVEPIEIHSDVLSITMRPDSKEIAVSTLDGNISIWDIEDAKQLHLIDGKKDIIGGRFLEDRFTSKNAARSKFFTCIGYSFDGLTLVAAGNNNSICMYDIANEVLLKRFTVSQNMQLNGTLKQLNSSRLTANGESLDLIDRDGENSDLEDRLDITLPGSHKGDPSLRNVRPEIRVTSIVFSPTAAAFAAASTEGLLIYSVDETILFDPFDLDVDITPESTLESLKEKEYLTALIMAFRLNEDYLIHKVYETIPINDIKLVSQDLPIVYLDRLLTFIGKLVMESSHLEFNLLWVQSLITSHGKYINAHKHLFSSSLKSIQRFLARLAKDVVLVSKRTGYLQSYLTQETRELDTYVEEEEEHVNDDEEMDEDDEQEHNDNDDSDGEGWLGAANGKKAGDAFEEEGDSESDEEMESN